MASIRITVVWGCLTGLALGIACGSNSDLDAISASPLVTGGRGGVGPRSGGMAPSLGYAGAQPTGGQRSSGGAPCTGDFNTVAYGEGLPCPTDFPSALVWRWPNGYPCEETYVGSCNGLLAFFRYQGEGGKFCYYDPGSGALVGAVVVGDTSYFCNDTSASIGAGHYPSDCPLDYLTESDRCAPATGGSGPGTGGTGGIAPTGGALATGGAGDIDCDARRVTCSVQAPSCGSRYPRVVGACYDGTCVNLEDCQCTAYEECPYSGVKICYLGHCDYPGD
jgi:hypothetical protein